MTCSPPSLESALGHANAHADQHLRDLVALAARPSVSAAGRPRAALADTADAVAALLRSSGLAGVEALTVPGAPPYVYAEWLGAAGAPTVLAYCHHDVQPEGDPAAWRTPAFAPTVRGGRLYARGAADDKGGVVAIAAAVAAYLGSSGALPLNLKVLIEGEEEIGSPHLGWLLARERQRALLFLSRRDVADLLDLRSCIAAVEQAFRRHAEGRSVAPRLFGLPMGGGGLHAKGAGLLLESAYAAVKVNANFPGNPGRFGLPTIQGLVVLFDGERGVPLAVMDSAELTALRTAAATAVAARHLARPESEVATIVGCGVQGREQLRALALVLRLRRAYAIDLDPQRARALARDLAPELGFPIESGIHLDQALGVSDVCVTCTTSRQALLRRAAVRGGTFIAAVGTDSEDKQELEPQLLAAATVVPDVLEQAAVIGELHWALEEGLMSRDRVHAELADIVAGLRPGRTSVDEITIFDSTGTALQDVAAAVVVFEQARVRGRGVRLDLDGMQRPATEVP
jgi:alanine dehydrogenase